MLHCLTLSCSQATCLSLNEDLLVRLSEDLIILVEHRNAVYMEMHHDRNTADIGRITVINNSYENFDIFRCHY